MMFLFISIQRMKYLLLHAHAPAKTANVVISRCCFEGRHEIVKKCVQHVYFSQFDQSNPCFVALLLSLPSSMLKLPNDGAKGTANLHRAKKKGRYRMFCSILTAIPVAMLHQIGVKF